MSTLEQELLADFGDSDTEADIEHGAEDAADALNGDFADSPGEGDEDDSMDVDEEAQLAKQYEEKQRKKGPSGLKGAQALLQELQPVLDEIEHQKDSMQEAVIDGIPLEENPEYILLSRSNAVGTRIEDAIHAVHTVIRESYSPRFPNLETMIRNPVDYAKTVAIIGNGPMNDIKTIAQRTDNLIGQALKTVIDGPQLMVLTVEATHTDGRDLTDDELAEVRHACSIMLELDKAKTTVTDYVESRMAIFAPNLTALIGSRTASQLLNYAGSLSGLAKTPSCNLAPLGAKRSTGTGFATNTGIRNQGFLYHSPIIQSIRQDLQVQAMRFVSAKVILAARVDSVHEATDGAVGREFKEACEKRLDKLVEPPKNQGTRALPVPEDKPSRKRGGRRARKMKEATAMTEIRKAQNRMVFGKEEKETSYGIGDSTKGLGMIGATDSGRIRAQAIDTRTRAKLSKKNPGWGGGAASAASGATTALKVGGGGTTTTLKSGGAASIAFTPVQGLELVDPRAREQADLKRKAAENRWFGSGTFSQIGNGSAPTPKVDSAGFKVPSLPVKKRKLDNGDSQAANGDAK